MRPIAVFVGVLVSTGLAAVAPSHNERAARADVIALVAKLRLPATPRAEMIPAGVREIDITTAPLAGAATRSLTVSSGSRIRRIVALIDAMPIVQTGVYGCPALRPQGAQRITLLFRSGAARTVVARATYIAYPGLALSSGPCKPVQFWIGRREQRPLLGGSFVRRLDRIIGSRLL